MIVCFSTIPFSEHVSFFSNKIIEPDESNFIIFDDKLDISIYFNSALKLNSQSTENTRPVSFPLSKMPG